MPSWQDRPVKAGSTVFVLGAGFSVEAGVPLAEGFFRREIDAHAKRHVPLAGNNWSAQHQAGTPFVEHLDFWVGETSVQYGNPTAQRIYEKTKGAEALGKLQVFSPMNDGPDRIPTREAYVALARRIIATSYACGTSTLVPWDVWRRGPDNPIAPNATEAGRQLNRRTDIKVVLANK